MALGVLNNLSAIYAENNLNNTNNSLQTVLQQLSSGSRINSGADDAAGLSLVNGLAANSAALTQSETNATEGVGLLQVADGALSQVTSLLNRAITLATEASNGTLEQRAGGGGQPGVPVDSVRDQQHWHRRPRITRTRSSTARRRAWRSIRATRRRPARRSTTCTLPSSPRPAWATRAARCSRAMRASLSICHRTRPGSLTTAAQQSDAIAGSLVVHHHQSRRHDEHVHHDRDHGERADHGDQQGRHSRA